MKLTIFGLTIVAGAALIIAGLHGQLDWASTPNGHAALAWLLFAVLVTVLACLGMRTHVRDRDAREAQEWADLDAWEEAMHLTAAQDLWRGVGEDVIRSVTRAELDAEDERLTTTVVPEPVTAAWPTRQTPMLLDLAPTYVRDAPLVRWRPPNVGDPDPYLGQAAWWLTSMRDGDEYYVEPYAGRVLQGLSRTTPPPRPAYAEMSQAFGHVVEAMPVSPAPQGRTSHRRGVAEGTETQQADPDFVSWEQADWEQPTGAFPILAAAMAGA